MNVFDWLHTKLNGKGKGKTTLSAKIIRKDGTVEDLGVISETANEPWEVKGNG